MFVKEFLTNTTCMADCSMRNAVIDNRTVHHEDFCIKQNQHVDFVRAATCMYIKL